MSVERRGPAICNVSNTRVGEDEMTKTSNDSQDLKRRICVKAKAELLRRFWSIRSYAQERQGLGWERWSRQSRKSPQQDRSHKPRIALSHLLHVEVYGTYPAGATFGSAYSIVPSRGPVAPEHTNVLTRNAGAVRPSPRRIFSASGPANHWTSLSSRPRLPLCWRRYKWQGPFAPRTLLRFIATTDPSATLSSSADFPVSPVIRPTLLRRFLAGTRRASPVAQHALVTVLSLSPRRGDQSFQSVFAWSCCLRPPVAGSALGLRTFEATMRSLLLRPGDS